MLIAMLASAGSAWGEGSTEAGQPTISTIKFVQLAQTQEMAEAACREAPNRRCVIELALAVTGTIQNKFEHTQALEIISRTQADGGDFDAALTTISRIEGMLIRPSPLLDIAVAQAKAGDIDAAIGTAEKIEDTFDRTLALTRMIDATAARRNQAGAQATIAAALAAAEAIDYANPRALALSGVAESAAAAGDIPTAQKAIKLALAAVAAIPLAEGRSIALPPVAEAQATVGDFDAALASGARIQSSSRRAETLARIAEAQAKVGSLEAAKATIAKAKADADAARGDPLRESALVEIAKAQATAGDAKGALATAGSMNDFRTVALFRMIETYAAKGEDDAALAATESIDDETARGELMAAAAKAMVEAGRIEAAQRAIKTAAAAAGALAMPDDSRGAIRHTFLFGEIAEVQFLAGDPDGARKTLNAMLEATKGSNDPDLNDLTLALIVKSSARSGDAAGLLMTAARIERLGSRVEALTWIAEALPN
jgi:hypothetical protein